MQSRSVVHWGLTQTLLTQIRLPEQSISSLHGPQQPVKGLADGDGEGDLLGDGDGEGDLLGDGDGEGDPEGDGLGEALTVKVKVHTAAAARLVLPAVGATGSVPICCSLRAVITATPASPRISKDRKISSIGFFFI